jgi:predicted cupin superfamily sugar epimerase
MNEPAYWIEKLGLVRHPEGGWYREVYRSPETIARAALPPRYSSDRRFSTAIYYLLESGQRSALHRLKSDELWFFHTGCPLSLCSIAPDGNSHVTLLGSHPECNESFQAMIPAGDWFGARPSESGSYSLVSCTVAPGFDFSDFEMGKRDQLLALFPGCREIIEQLANHG